MIKEDDPIFVKLSQDVPFKFYFTGQENLLISLLASFLPLPADAQIVSVKILNPELLSKQISKLEGQMGKTFICDLHLEIQMRYSDRPSHLELVNVEMQATNQPYLIKRSLAYISRLYSGQLKRGESHSRLSPVYCLMFTTKGLKEFTSTDEYHHVCQLRSSEFPHKVVDRDFNLIFVELNKFHKDLKDLVEDKDFGVIY